MKHKIIEFGKLVLGLGCLVALFAWTTTRYMERQKLQDNKVYIYIEDIPYELVFDDYDNPFVKQTINNQTIYIPYPFEMEETEEEITKPKK